ncbi:MAG TPA: DUF5107 domain-containing protein [Pyrinomonadaceae bacterium]|jgi:tetratricopeptide (TPR) repeat protein
MVSIKGKTFTTVYFIFAIMVLCGGGAVSIFASEGDAKEPRVWEEPLSIPTYELGAPNPYPALLDWDRRKWRPVYPYPMLDAIGTRKVDKNYRAVYLENEFLRVTVLPELGGHLYAIYDKTAARDVLYTNHVVKYAMVGIRGAWVSGGIEWNFPDGHTLTTVSPIDYATRTEPDGSASVTVGDTERVQGMQWAVTIRLRPGQRRVETEVTLNNRQLTPGRYWYWSTAAAPATDDMRFVYPMRETYPHVFYPVYSFPREKGVDLSTFRDVPNYLSLFARNSKRDFFGVYYEKSDWGIVHVADHRELPGKKTWTWGTDEAGDIWVDKLTDSDGQYVEFQAGRFETQMEHEFIAPHRVETFTEYWYPVNRLGGGWDEANRDAAARLKIENDRAVLSINVNARFDDAEIALENESGAVWSKKADLEPARPFSETIALPKENARNPLTVVVKSKTKSELLRYRTDAPFDGNPRFEPATRPQTDPEVPTSAEQAYLKGLTFARKSQEREMRAAFGEALKRDPNHSPARVGLGLSYYRSGEYQKAANELEKALARDPASAEARYYLALVRRAEGRLQKAEELLQRLVREGSKESLARYVLGEMALSVGRAEEAVEHFARAVALEPRDLKARTALAVAERLAGKADAAQRNVDAVLWQMPIDYLALHEKYELAKARGKDEQAEAARGELWRVLAREPDSVLTLAFDYAALGRRFEARRVLEEAVASAGTKSLKPSPMFHYTLGYFYALDGEAARACEQFARGAQLDPAYVFPHRVEEIEVLRAVTGAAPTDGRAFYYLGNAYASRLRAAEALAAWQTAVRLDQSNAVARRNLARALWVVAGQKTEAAREYQAALGLKPDDHRLYVEYDKLLEASGAPAERVKTLEAAPATVQEVPAFAQALADAYTDAGEYEKAAQLLEKHEFTTGEGELSALAVYRRAHLGLARKFQASGDHTKAAAEFLKATEYPKNLGVGRPAIESQAREYVFAAREFERAGKPADAKIWWERAALDELVSPVQPEMNWSEHYFYKAAALEKIGRQAEARALYERLARLADERAMLAAEPIPPAGAIRFVLAGAGLKALGRDREARAALERALALDPQSELAREQLAAPRPERKAPAGNRKTKNGE